MSDFEQDLRKKRQFKALKTLIWFVYPSMFLVLTAGNYLSMQLENQQLFQIVALLAGIFFLILPAVISTSGQLREGTTTLVGRVIESERAQVVARTTSMGAPMAEAIIVGVVALPAVILILSGAFLQVSELTLIIFILGLIISVLVGSKLSAVFLQCLKPLV